MDYLVSVIDDELSIGGNTTGNDDSSGDAFNERLKAEGHWVYANGLAAPSAAKVIDNRDGKSVFTDGPFLESREYVSGFWIINAPNLDVALRLAAEGSRACNRKIEVRPADGESA